MRSITIRFLVATVYFPVSSLFSLNACAQGAAINTTGASPDPSSVLDVSSQQAGILIPRLTTGERNSIPDPAQGLQIFNISTGCIDYYFSGQWFSLCGSCDPPAQPSLITGEPGPCAGETGLTYSVDEESGVTYTWTLPSGWVQTAGGTSHSIEVTAGTAPGNVLVTPSTICGNGVSQALSVSPLAVLSSVPTAGVHYPSATQIVWNWSPVSGAAGYRFHTTNDPNTASDLGNVTTYTQTGLTCGNTAQTVYVWAYNECGFSPVLVTAQHTAACASFTCGNNFTMTHIAGAVAPVTKTVTYGTVSSSLTGTAKCWITRNLGADNQASSSVDNTETSAGWYWQFNRTQGFKHDGSTRTPGTTWNADFDANVDWTSANDPCAILLGSGWRIPTSTEWGNADLNGGWTNYTTAFSSVLKLHAAGLLNSADGTLGVRGTNGYYWSSNLWGPDGNYGLHLLVTSSAGTMDANYKTRGFPVRCLKD